MSEVVVLGDMATMGSSFAVESRAEAASSRVDANFMVNTDYSQVSTLLVLLCVCRPLNVYAVCDGPVLVLVDRQEKQVSASVCV